MEIKIQLSTVLFSIRLIISLFMYILFRLGNLQRENFYIVKRLRELENRVDKIARPNTKTATYGRLGQNRKKGKLKK